jgi:hypothetical protein
MAVFALIWILLTTPIILGTSIASATTTAETDGDSPPPPTSPTTPTEEPEEPEPEEDQEPDEQHSICGQVTGAAVRSIGVAQPVHSRGAESYAYRRHIGSKYAGPYGSPCRDPTRQDTFADPKGGSVHTVQGRGG